MDQQVVDGLLELGNVEVVGFYTALKRFIDRRPEADRAGQVMEWSVTAFCRKMRVGRDKFYRLMDLLWQVGLVDVEKVVDNPGWHNRYIVHDYPAYDGNLRKIREGTFRHSKAGAGKPDGEAAEGRIPEAGILRSPETGLLRNPDPGLLRNPDPGLLRNPVTRIPDSRILETGLTNKQLREKDNRKNSNKGEPPSSPDGEEGGRDGAPALPDDRTLIAELTARLHELPGVKPLRGHYSLIGRAYKEYGYQVVSEALEDMEFALVGRQAMGLPDVSEKELAQMLFGKCRWNQKPVRRPGDRPAARTPGTDDIEAWCREHGYVRVPGTNRLVKASPPDGNGRGKCAGQG
jgi:hypothetical protein